MPEPDNSRDEDPYTAFGSWSSLITTDLILSDSISIHECKQTTEAVYFIECRPQQAGRSVIVRYQDNIITDLLPEPYSARSCVHEYGGGSYCITHDEQKNEILFFVNDDDQDIYRLADGVIDRITANKDMRFADFVYDARHKRLIAVCEQHLNSEVTNSIVSITIDEPHETIEPLLQGADFYASPRLNSTATKLCWQSWNLPDMPWDSNQLWLADIDEQIRPESVKTIAGGNNISTFQPQWSPDDVLFFISDDTGWWHLYRYIDESIQQLTFSEKEFGLPQWVFAQSRYSFLNASTLICIYQSTGITRLATLSLGPQFELTALETPYQEFFSISACHNKLCFIAASSQTFPQLVSASCIVEKAFDTSDRPSDSTVLQTQIIKHSCQMNLADEYFSAAQTINFNNRHQQQVYANYYPPCNPQYSSQQEKSPPLIVICHGGPSGQSGTALDPKKQFWTSRGFALLDVNYSGSTGYGRQYRERLDKRWGLADVQDCCDAALYAVEQGLADSEQLIIRGSSAGGYTVLAALTFEDVFSAGASYYGISELCSLATDTHKFESRYLDRLIGPYPEDKNIYQQRSPINSTEQLNCPVIFFQGMQDKVVPKEQAEEMFTVLEEKGLTVAAQYFEGEQHGFRQAETIKQTLENELAFYQLVLGIKEKDEICFLGDITIRNI